MPVSLTKTQRTSKARGTDGLHKEAPPTAHGVDGGLSFSIPASARTLDGFRKWSWSEKFPQQGRIDFIAGEIVVDMSKEKLVTHVAVKGELYLGVGLWIRKNDLGIFYADGTGVSNVAAELSCVPDAVFVSWASFEKNKVRQIPDPRREHDFLELEGTPDLVAEIVSDSSVIKDTKKLMKRYHLAGIPEYWLIDARKADLSFQILRHADDGYVVPPRKNGWQLSSVLGASFKFSRSKNRLGTWQYHLEIKEVGQ